MLYMCSEIVNNYILMNIWLCLKTVIFIVFIILLRRMCGTCIQITRMYHCV